MVTKKPNRRPNTTCDLCLKPIYRRKSQLSKQKGKHCSRACRNRAYPYKGHRTVPESMKGANNPAWKGGVTMFRKKGNYANIRYLRAPDWAKPMARKDGYVMEHRLIMARVCGFLLTREEVVHHRNHNLQDTTDANLELWPNNRSHKIAEYGRFVAGSVNRYCPLHWNREP